MVIILAALILSIVGIVRLGRTLEPRQRVVLVLTVVCAAAYLLFTLARLGYVGHSTPGLER